MDEADAEPAKKSVLKPVLITLAVVALLTGVVLGVLGVVRGSGARSLEVPKRLYLYGRLEPIVIRDGEELGAFGQGLRGDPTPLLSALDAAKVESSRPFGGLGTDMMASYCYAFAFPVSEVDRVRVLVEDREVASLDVRRP